MWNVHPSEDLVGQRQRDEFSLTRLGGLGGHGWGAKEGKFGWKCLAEWQLVCEAMQDEVNVKGLVDGPVKELYKAMEAEWGPDHLQWPIVGCGQGFNPSKDVPSMTFNVELEDGWKAIMSERLPTVLDDAFKSARLMSMSELCDGLNVELIFKWLPMAFPQGFNVAEARTGRPIHGVAQYQIEKWKQPGRPYMTVEYWIKCCMIVGEGKPKLAENVEVAEMFEDTNHEDHKYNLKNMRKRHEQRMMAGFRNATMGDLNVDMKKKAEKEGLKDGAKVVLAKFAAQPKKS